MTKITRMLLASWIALLLMLFGGVNRARAEEMIVTVLNEYGSTVDVQPVWERQAIVGGREVPFWEVRTNTELPPPNQDNIGHWVQRAKDVPRVAVVVTSLSDPGLKIPPQCLPVGERTITFPNVSPGRYAVTASTVVQFDDNGFFWDTGRSPSEASGTKQEILFPPVPDSGEGVDRGVWSVVSMQGMSDPVSDDPAQKGRTYHYQLGVRYTYLSANRTYTSVRKGDTGAKADNALVVLITNSQVLGRLAWEGHTSAVKQVFLREEPLSENITMSVAESKITDILAKVFSDTIPKLSEREAALYAGTYVNLIKLGMPDPTLDKDLRIGSSVASVVMTVALVGGGLELMAVGIGTDLVLGAIADDIQRDRLKEAAKQALFDDVVLRIVRDSKRRITQVDVRFDGPEVATPALYFHHFANIPIVKLPVCPFAQEWISLTLPEANPIQPTASDFRDEFTKVFDEQPGEAEISCDQPLFLNVQSSELILEDLRWPLDKLDTEDVSLSSRAQGMLDVVFLPYSCGTEGVEGVKEEFRTVQEALTKLGLEEGIDVHVGFVGFHSASPTNAPPNPTNPPPDPTKTPPGPTGDFDTQRLSSDAEPTRNEVNGLQVTDKLTEDLYSGMMYAMNQPVDGQSINMGWRPGAAKMLFPIAVDLPFLPKRFTSEQVAQTAHDLDPVHIYPLVFPLGVPLEHLPFFENLAGLAGKTGGEVINVRNTKNLHESLLKAVKLSIRQHKEEVWRKANPPYLLYSLGIAVAVIAVLGIAGLFAKSMRRPRWATEFVPDADPRLSGEPPAKPRQRDERSTATADPRLSGQTRHRRGPQQKA